MEHEPKQQIETPFAVAHPVRTMYAKMLDAMGRMADAAEMLTFADYEGNRLQYAAERRFATLDAAKFQALIVVGYFSDNDLEEVYPGIRREGVMGRITDFAVESEVYRKQVLIHRVCEARRWFEDWEHRMSAEEIPEF